MFGRSAPSAEKCAPAKPQFLSFGAKPDSLNNSVNKLKDSSSDISSNASDYKGLTMRRGSSVENIGNQDFVNANGKKVKYENEVFMQPSIASIYVTNLFIVLERI